MRFIRVFLLASIFSFTLHKPNVHAIALLDVGIIGTAAAGFGIAYLCLIKGTSHPFEVFLKNRRVREANIIQEQHNQLIKEGNFIQGKALNTGTNNQMLMDQLKAQQSSFLLDLAKQSKPASAETSPLEKKVAVFQLIFPKTPITTNSPSASHEVKPTTQSQTTVAAEAAA